MQGDAPPAGECIPLRPSGYPLTRSLGSESLARCFVPRWVALLAPPPGGGAFAVAEGLERLRGHLARRGARIGGRHLVHEPIEIGDTALQEEKHAEVRPGLQVARVARDLAPVGALRLRHPVQTGQRVRALELQA